MGGNLESLALFGKVSAVLIAAIVVKIPKFCQKFFNIMKIL